MQTLDLGALLVQAEQAKSAGHAVVGLGADQVAELVSRLQAAEGELSGFKQIVGAEVLRCQPGDVVVVELNATWLGGSSEYEFYRKGMMSVLPDGVKAIIKVPGVDLSVLTDEQLAAVGLAKISNSLAAPNYLGCVGSFQQYIKSAGYVGYPADEGYYDNDQAIDIAEAAWNAAWSAATNSAVPEGWQLVPVEPTEAMLDMAQQAAAATGGFPEVWAAMLAAAPKPEGGAA